MAQCDDVFTGVADSNGNAVIRIQPSNNQRWEIKQVTPEAENAPGTASGKLKKNGATVSPFLAAGDVIADAPTVFLTKSDVMTVEWTGLTPGDPVSAYVIWDDGQG